MDIHPNRLIIIGNGFDLAHKMPTKYEDFLVWYFKKLIKQFEELPLTSENPGQVIETPLVKLSPIGTPYSTLHPSVTDKIKERKNLGQLITNEYLSFSDKTTEANKPLAFVLIEFKNTFFHDITEKKENWSDIEQAYFDRLVAIHSVTSNSKDEKLKLVVDANKCMSELTIQLAEYLSEIKLHKLEEFEDLIKANILSEIKNDKISNLHFNNFLIQREKESKRIKKETQERIIWFLNFNYTDTLSQYIEGMELKGTRVIQSKIHGDLSKSSSLVFGYGDESNEHYKKLEAINKLEFLEKMKSFFYSKTDEYLKLVDFMSSKEFDVFVIGHSLGLSDRVLLKSIFENDNCKAIRLFHRGEEEHFFKSISLSRHFSNKTEMRNKLIPYNENDSFGKASDLEN